MKRNIARTNNKSSTLLLVQLFPQVVDFFLELLARKLQVEDLGLLIWPCRSFIAPDLIDQIVFDAHQAGAAFLFDFLQQFTSIS